MPKFKYITYAEAINEALDLSLKKDPNLLCYGLGVSDPKEVFNTTKNLQKKYSSERVFDIPCSENALTGVGIGCAIQKKCRVVMTHQRLDFSLLSLDQIINNASKFYYMFNKKIKVPITIRMIVGRGWGQGPTHSQSLQSIFSHIPGLKVVMPSNANDAKKFLINSIFDDNPVIYIEHRWLHEQKGRVEKGFTKKKISNANILKRGKDLTIVASSHMTTEAIIAGKILQKNNIAAEIIDLRSIKPLDFKKIEKSVSKTKRLIILDSGFSFGSIANEIISSVHIRTYKLLKHQPIKISMPDCPVPTGFSLTKIFTQIIKELFLNVKKCLAKKFLMKKIKTNYMMFQIKNI